MYTFAFIRFEKVGLIAIARATRTLLWGMKDERNYLPASSYKKMGVPTKLRSLLNECWPTATWDARLLINTRHLAVRCLGEYVEKFELFSPWFYCLIPTILFSILFNCWWIQFTRTRTDFLIGSRQLQCWQLPASPESHPNSWSSRSSSILLCNVHQENKCTSYRNSNLCCQRLCIESGES